MSNSYSTLKMTTYYPHIYTDQIDPDTYEKIATVQVFSVTGDTAVVIGADNRRYELPCRQLRESWDRLHRTVA